ncbi:MAG TPA: primosomal protein N' [Burkholderiales bacterium]|nr:primosomal protein N' [Burkholderiales bacterium]
MTIARVALDVPLKSLFDYRTGDVAPLPGQLVVVPFGRRRDVGVVVELAERSDISDSRLRRIEHSLPLAPLPQELLALTRFCSDYYHYPLGRVLLSVLPSVIRRANYIGPTRQWEYVLTRRGRELHPDSFRPAALVKRRLLAALSTSAALGHAQARSLSARAPALLQQWMEAGWVEKRPASVPATTGSLSEQGPELTHEQREAVDRVSATFGTFSPWLMHGVTGSGKTEVYFRLIEIAIARGSQSLLMVPEINLTPQLEARFIRRFPGVSLVSLHSGLSEGERCERWLAALTGDAQVVLGTRLSVFTPLPRLGLVIVDEEHDVSFKQHEGLRYSARDLAVFRARQRRVPIVLGSATPALESYLNARNGRFGSLHLSTRPAASPPQIRLIETRAAHQTHGMSDPLLQAIRERLVRGEQSLVFLNRRGFAPAMLCGACGWTAQCSRCAARLVWHLRGARLRCHYCGHEEPLPPACPDCGNLDLKGLGQGTQRLEQALAGIFPDARILRIDRDSTRHKRSWEVMRDDIQEGRVNILVGTQMLAKGHDFPKLTLVAVVNPDSALFSADFRAAEKLLQQLIQVTGRAGRADLPGEALVQTQFPAHPLYQALVRQDYRAFAEELLAERKRSGFPPFVYQALLRAEALREGAVTDFLAQAVRSASGHDKAVTLYDPVPAAIPRVAGHHRAHLLVQSPARGALQRFLANWVPALSQKKAGRVRWSIDIDPLEL